MNDIKFPVYVTGVDGYEDRVLDRVPLGKPGSNPFREAISTAEMLCVFHIVRDCEFVEGKGIVVNMGRE